jgi:hypothetical protein
VLTTQHPIFEKVGTNFADKLRSLGEYSLLADSGHGVYFLFVCPRNCFVFFRSQTFQRGRESDLRTVLRWNCCDFCDVRFQNHPQQLICVWKLHVDSFATAVKGEGLMYDKFNNLPCGGRSVGVFTRVRRPTENNSFIFIHVDPFTEICA